MGAPVVDLTISITLPPTKRVHDPVTFHAIGHTTACSNGAGLDLLIIWVATYANKATSCAPKLLLGKSAGAYSYACTQPRCMEQATPHKGMWG